MAPTPNQITREASSRHIDVSCNVRGNDLGSVARDIAAEVKAVDFDSLRLSLLVILCLPFALTGSILSAFCSGGVLSLGSMIGFVTVLGIAARNSIMLISHYRHLEMEENLSFGKELILRGALERLAPILMTTLTTALALIPIVLGGNRPGCEIEHPMAVVILGGLLTSAIMNLLFMPALYWTFAKAHTHSD